MKGGQKKTPDPEKSRNGVFVLFIKSLLAESEKRKVRVAGSTFQEIDKKDINNIGK